MKGKAKAYSIGFAVFLLVGGIGYVWWSSSGWTYSEGSRVGVVIKFSHKGSFMKTWEGELAMGQVDQGGTREKWEFSAYPAQDGENIVEEIEAAMDSGKRVKIHYRQQYGTQSWKGATTYFVTEVEYLE